MLPNNNATASSLAGGCVEKLIMSGANVVVVTFDDLETCEKSLLSFYIPFCHRKELL